MKTRADWRGAWVRLDEPPVLVAVDRARARRLGVDGGALWNSPVEIPVAPLEAHVAVTSRCGAGCPACYLDARPDGEAPPFDEIVARLDALAQAGVFTVAFGGGEPLSRPDLGRLAAAARDRGLAPVLTTSGIGLSAARASELTAFEQINVSHDGVGGGYEGVRGFDGEAVATRAIGLLAGAGIRVGVNLVLTRRNRHAIEATAEQAAGLGAREIQLLRCKPGGRATGLAYLALRLSPDEVAAVPALIERILAAGRLSVRIDCAMVPWLSDRFLDPAPLARLGVFGCEAGRHLAAVTVDGQLSPCSFSAPAALPVTDLAAGWATDPILAAARGHVDHAPEPCSSCPIAAVCRGGCRVVAAHAGDPDGPDPECPRVRRWSATRTDS
jgi:radical SAM protein with 4Fe4S-binding SPASM domain